VIKTVRDEERDTEKAKETKRPRERERERGRKREHELTGQHPSSWRNSLNLLKIPGQTLAL